MGYIVNGREIFEMPENGIEFEFANPCSEMGHEYADKICPACGRDFCYACSKNTNVHEGGKYAPDFMECPGCGHDYYDE